MRARTGEPVTAVRTRQFPQGAESLTRQSTDEEGAMTMHDYKSWRIGVEAFERSGQWSARVEVSDLGRVRGPMCRCRCLSMALSEVPRRLKPPP